jgi:hypothetical protein
MSAVDPTTPAVERTQAGDAQAAGTPKAGSSAAGAAAKPSQRPVAEIRADIEKERGELAASFTGLRGELDEAVDAGKKRADDMGKKAKRVAPLVAGAVATLVVARAILKRRSRK